jgi:hypothetical protein
MLAAGKITWPDKTMSTMRNIYPNLLWSTQCQPLVPAYVLDCGKHFFLFPKGLSKTFVGAHVSSFNLPPNYGVSGLATTNPKSTYLSGVFDA